MTENAAQLRAIETSIKVAKEKIEVYKILERLQSNKDFKDLIEQRYLRDYALRLVAQKSQYQGVSTNDISQRRSIDKRLDAISFLNEYFLFIAQEGKAAVASLERDEEEREAILEEGV